MCEPITMSTLAMISVGSSVLGAAGGAAGSIYSAAQQSQSQKDQARMATRQANLEQVKANRDIENARIERNQIMGAQRAAYAASGVDISGSPSADEVAISTAMESARKIDAIRFGADVRSQNYQMQASNLRSEAKSTMISGAIGAGANVTREFSNPTFLNAAAYLVG